MSLPRKIKVGSRWKSGRNLVWPLGHSFKLLLQVQKIAGSGPSADVFYMFSLFSHMKIMFACFPMCVFVSRYCQGP